MSRTRQISITLPGDLIDVIKAAVDRGEARSVSSYIAARLEPGMAIAELFAEWDADRGELSAEVTAWAEAEVDRVIAAPDNPQRGDLGAA